MILQSMLLLSLAMLGQGSYYDINEQQINQYLQSQVQVDKQLGTARHHQGPCEA